MMKAAKTRTKKFTYFIGIDVSKNKLDYAVMHASELLFHREAKNESDAILTFVNELKMLPRFTIRKTIFCMEDTGIYCNHLLNSLKKLKANVIVENPLHLKYSSGMTRGKNDKVDAIRIAQYAKKNCDELNLWVSRRPIIDQLVNLFAIRNRLLGLSVALNAPLKEQNTFVRKEMQKLSLQSSKRSMDAFRLDLADINSAIDELIDTDEHLKRLKMLITSVPNIGSVTATCIIICTGEFKEIKDPKKFACYAGIAPFKNESGRMVRKAKISPIANRKIKSLLHICALAAIRWDKELKAYYERKTIKEGKAKMAVINAIRNKLILRVFACVNQDRCYIRGYVNSRSVIPADCLAVEN
jgi:transposase